MSTRKVHNYLEMGRIYRENQDYDSAIEELRQALELGLDNEEIHLELGRTYREKGEYPKAKEELKAALRLEPTNGYTHLELARIYRERGDYEVCLKELQQTRQCGLNNDQVHIELSQLYQEKGEDELATEELKTALKFNPKNGYIHFELGRLYQKKKDYDSALSEIEQAQELGYDNVEVHQSLGLLYRAKKEYDQSAQEFQEVLKISPQANEPFFYNKILNEMEISQKKIVLNSKPRILGITLTNNCNLRCIICQVWKEPWEITQKTIQEVIELFPYLELVVWQGGEVFLLDYFAKLFEKAASYPNLKQSIITNGLLIDEKWAKKLARGNLSLTIGIDGVNKKTYEYIRRGARFEDLLKSLDTLNKYKQKYNQDVIFTDRMITIMNFVVMKSNYHELNKTVDFAKRYGFDTLQLYTIEGIVDLGNIFLHNDRQALEYIKEVMPEVSKKAKEYGICLDSSLSGIEQDLRPRDETERQKASFADSECPDLRKTNEMMCYLPWQQMFMTPEHKLKAGCYCRCDIGDVHKNSLKEIWNGEMMQLYRQKLLDNDSWQLCYRIPKELDAHFELMRLHYMHKDYPLVIKGLNKLKEFVNLNPDNLAGHMLLGRIYFTIQREYVLAMEEFKQALKLSPQNCDIHYELGLILRKLQDYDSAIKEIKQAQELGFNKKADAHLELGSIYREKRDFTSAIKALKKAIELGLDNDEIHLELGRIFREKGQLSKALEELKKALEINPQNWQIQEELDRAYGQRT